jgi:hypothetical protein
MGDERVELGERSGVQEKLEPLAGGELSARVLLLDPVRSPTLQRRFAHPLQASDPIVVRRWHVHLR